jgi:WhiB family redox-sensing transcriptional regulator
VGEGLKEVQLDESILQRPTWHQQALCRRMSPSLFFIAGRSDIARYDQEQAKAVCVECPVRSECLAFALKNEEAFGIWGGLTPEERLALKKIGTDGPSQ